MLLHVDLDVNRCKFFSAFLDLQSIRDDEFTTSKELIFLNALPWCNAQVWAKPVKIERKKDVHGKHELKLQTLAKQWRSMKASELFWKYPQTPDFDHWNYRLFERIPAVHGTSNNRGLTVLLWGWTVDAGPEPTYVEKMRVPPPPWGFPYISLC